MIDKFRISKVRAMEIINGRGIPAVQVEVTTSGGVKSVASSPSGISISGNEAVEVRDGGKRLMGKGVLKAVENVNKYIEPKIIGMDVRNQYEMDKAIILLDGTSNMSRLGGNATTAVSLAIVKAAAAQLCIPIYRYLGGIKANKIPIICPNLISGSKTAGNQLDFEDYLIVPFGFDTIRKAITASVEVFHVLHKILKRKYGLIPQITALAPPLKTNDEAFSFILEAISRAGYEGKISLAIDVASELIYDKKKDIYKINNKTLNRDGMIDLYRELVEKYPIIFIEDGLNENDFEGFSLMNRKVDCLIVGDDLFGTNKRLLSKGYKYNASNGAIFKVNQVATVSKFLQTAEYARDKNYTIISSTRSGETDDSIQVDLAVSIRAKYMKVGAPIRGEMVTKYNRFLQIEEELGEEGEFLGEIRNN